MPPDLYEVEVRENSVTDPGYALVGTKLVSLDGALNRLSAKDLHKPTAACVLYNNSAMMVSGFTFKLWKCLG